MCSLKQTFQYITGTEQMYHQQQQQFQSHSQHLSSRSSLPPDNRFLLQEGGDSGLVLSTDAKPRLKWTSELHQRFVEAVNQLGGPDKATPKAIMRVMGIPGLTLYHLKSHLQKYRLGKNLQAQANSVHAENGCVKEAADKAWAGHGSQADHLHLETQTSKSMDISEALQMQIEVQRRLHEQLQVQRHLQLRIEAQGKYLQSVLEKAQESLAKQNVAGTADEEASKAQQSELVWRASARGPLQNDASVDSYLTACEVPRRGEDQDILSIGLSAAQRSETARSGKDRESAITGRDEEYYLFLDRPEHQERRRKIRRDGFNSSVAFENAELDLSINVANSRPRSSEMIDLNGSDWN